ncbi:hypothetical protein AB0D62_35735 [Streptomyces massasporeus]|uniref:hypothetical protein n=1 Tax=Streptomyces massasporeus TaxID=67324 RepID=UPI0034079935
MTGVGQVACPAEAVHAGAAVWRRTCVRRPEHRAPHSVLASYVAFRERLYEPYVLYTTWRMGRLAAAERVVAAAFTELAVSWTTVLGSASPAVVAWSILHDHVDKALGLGAVADAADALGQALPRDVAFLREHMHMSRDRIADVLGVRTVDLPSLPTSSPPE